MSIDDRTTRRPRVPGASVPGATTPGASVPGRPVPLRTVLAALASGAVAALVLVLVVFPGATEAVTTGSLLMGFGLGWALLRILPARAGARSQRWAVVPAVTMSATGACLAVLAPSDAVIGALAWIWPPAMLLLAAWTFHRARRTLTRAALLPVAAVLAVLVAASAGAVVARTTATDAERSYPASGRTYRVGDHQLHLDCRGDGGPTVVLLNGLGEFSAHWARIVAEVAEDARVCAYDRAGQGWSDDVDDPQDALGATADLHAVLAAAGEEGPFVLVGHSIGGAYALTYADRFPDSVAGMVLLDSSSPHQFTAISGYPFQYALMRRLYGVTPTLARVGLGSLLAGSHLPAEDAASVDAMVATARASRNGRDEVSVLPEVLRQAQALTSLGARPLAVLTSTESLDRFEGWAEAQQDLAALSSASVRRTVDATHAGLVEDERGAAASVRAIDSVVRAVRTATPPQTP